MSMNNLRKYLDKRNIGPEEFHKQLNKAYPWLNYAEITIKAWYYGYRNIYPDNAFYISEFFQGDLSRDELIYSPKRLTKLKNNLSKAA